MKQDWKKRLAMLVNLTPAAAVALLVAVAIPLTEPVLGQLPERLVVAAAEVQEQTEEIIEERPEEEPSEEVPTVQVVAADQTWPDGSYTGTAQGYGGPITVQVTVKDGAIDAIEVLDASGETASFFNRAKVLIDTVLAAQTWEVDVVSGATYSSRGILGAVENALTGIVVENEPAKKTEGDARALNSVSFDDSQTYTDGVYTGAATGFGGTITVQVTVSEGKLSNVAIVSAPGETASYLSRATGVISAMIGSGSPNVDVVSGATYSSNGIINAVKRALNQAAANGSVDELPEEPEPVDETDYEEQKVFTVDETTLSTKPEKGYKDGEYTGTGLGFGGDVTVQVTVQNGLITQIEILAAEDETSSYFSMATGMIPTILQGQSMEVDVISGATFSSEGIYEAIEVALSQAEVSEEQEKEPEDPADPVSPTDSEEPTDPTEPVDPENPADPENPTVPENPADPEEPVDPVEPEEPEEIEEGPYRNGVYTGTGTGYGGEIVVQVTIEGGKIASVDILSAEQETASFLRKARKLLPNVVQQQSAEVDVISGATYSSRGILDAVNQALGQAAVS